MTICKFPKLHLAGFPTDTCSKCHKIQECLILPCGHKYCDTCYFFCYRKKIKNLAVVLNKRPTSLDNKFSNIGCPNNCSSSILSIPPLWLAELFHNFEHTDLQETIISCFGFLSGICSHFKYCTKCNKIHGFTSDVCPISS